jgi:prophage antirepressor-like protein
MSGNRVCYFGGTSVQVINKGREPWFLVKDLGKLLKLTNIRKRLKEIPDETKDEVIATISLGGFKEQRQKMTVVNESGLYRLVMFSRTEAAEKFKTWVFDEVLPSIRKTGKYEHRKSEASMTLMPKDMSQQECFRISVNKRFRPLEWIEDKTAT